MRRPVSAGRDTLPRIDVLEAQRIRRLATAQVHLRQPSIRIHHTGLFRQRRSAAGSDWNLQRHGLHGCSAARTKSASAWRPKPHCRHGASQRNAFDWDRAHARHRRQRSLHALLGTPIPIRRRVRRYDLCRCSRPDRCGGTGRLHCAGAARRESRRVGSDWLRVIEPPSTERSCRTRSYSRRTRESAR